MIKSSQYVVQIQAVYWYRDRLWAMMELMDGGCLTPMLDLKVYGKITYSEQFCKYSLYSVLRALLDLH